MSERERDIIVEDPTLAAGFTQIPNQILRRHGLSPGAKLAFVMLLSYAWQDDACFPGQETLAADMGVSDRSVRTYLKELEKHKLITIHQRGLNRTNVYVLHRVGPEDISAPLPGPANISGQERKETTGQDRKEFPTTKTQKTKTQKTNEQDQKERERDDGHSLVDPIEIFKAMDPEERLLVFERQAEELRRLRRLEG